VYRDAVRGIGPQADTAEQMAAWASHPDDLAVFILGVGSPLIDRLGSAEAT
jgi:hypothetical protein